MEPSRKRRKTKGKPFTPSSKAYTFPAEIATAEELVQRNIPLRVRNTRGYTEPPTRRHVTFLDQGDLNSPNIRARCSHGFLVRGIPQSTAQCTERQFSAIPWFPQGRFVDEPQQMGSFIGDYYSKKGKLFGPSSDIQLLPRAHIRSCSEASGSYSTTQLERETLRNSTSTTTITNQNPSLGKITPRMTKSCASSMGSTTLGSHGELTSNSPSELAPLLSNSHQLAQQNTAVRPKLSHQQVSMEERHETFHIVKYKCLWGVAISIFVGIFLCLFLYAFHIVK